VKRIALGIVGLIAVSAAVHFLYRGPHMEAQINIRPFDAQVPVTPAGTVPVTTQPTVPSAEAAARYVNPLPFTAANAARGKVYYAYYCFFCHGPDGRGDGPVGQSYLPVPSDLRSPRFRSASDGQLLRSMLLGVGHDPVLARTVHPEHWNYLLLYLRQLAAPATQP
jgi:hypothetical protein